MAGWVWNSRSRCRCWQKVEAEAEELHVAKTEADTSQSWSSIFGKRKEGEDYGGKVFRESVFNESPTVGKVWLVR